MAGAAGGPKKSGLGPARAIRPLATWRAGASGLFVGPNQIHVADAEGQCQFIDRDNCRISSAFLQAADVLLTEPGNLRKLLLRQTLPLPDPLHIPSDQLAHIHARKPADQAA